jgi:hypothetical protein
LSAASLVLAAIAVMYGAWYSDMSRVLAIKPSALPASDEANYRFAVSVLRGRAVPLTVAATGATAIFAPDAVCIVVDLGRAVFLDHSIPSYNAVSTTLVAVEAALVFLAAQMIMRTVDLRAKVRELNPSR